LVQSRIFLTIHIDSTLFFAKFEPPFSYITFFGAIYCCSFLLTDKFNSTISHLGKSNTLSSFNLNSGYGLLLVVAHWGFALDQHGTIRCGASANYSDSALNS